MYQLHTVEGWTLDELAQRYHVSRERVRQLLYEYARDATGQRPPARAMSRAAAAARRARNLALARAHAHQILGAWRLGDEAKEIAATYELGRRCVEQVIHEEATPADRSARARVRRLAKAGLGHKPSAEQVVMHALALQPNATADDLAAATGVPYGSTAGILRKLERSCAAQRTKGGHDRDGRQLPDRWKLIDPAIGAPLQMP